MKKKKEKIMLEISGKWELRGDRNVNVGEGGGNIQERGIRLESAWVCGACECGGGSLMLFRTGGDEFGCGKTEAETK